MNNIVKKYNVATEGDTILDGMESMYAMGKVKMGVTEIFASIFTPTTGY